MNHELLSSLSSCRWLHAHSGYRTCTTRPPSSLIFFSFFSETSLPPSASPSALLSLSPSFRPRCLGVLVVLGLVGLLGLLGLLDVLVIWFGRVSRVVRFSRVIRVMIMIKCSGLNMITIYNYAYN